jgi:hypothetical protein
MLSTFDALLADEDANQAAFQANEAANRAANQAALLAVAGALTNIDTRIRNGMAANGPDPLTPLANAAGALPAVGVFPATFGDLHTMNAGDLRAALHFYGLPNIPVATQFTRFKAFIGVH